MFDLQRVVVRTQQYTEVWTVFTEDLPATWSTMSASERDEWLNEFGAYQSSDAGEFTQLDEIVSVDTV